MRLGIMQPYFFPYVGYFDTILKSDAWIVFDLLTYQPKSWMNRNRILDLNNGTSYITVPVPKGSSHPLAEIEVIDADQAGARVLRQLEIYRKAAPHYDAVVALVEGCFAAFSASSTRLRDLNVIGLKHVCDYLDIPFEFKFASDLAFDHSRVTHAGQWALEICAHQKATAYLNPSGGKALFKPAEWAARGIDLSFTRLPDLRYPVAGRFEFQPHLSILDCLMWMEPGQIKDYLQSLPLERFC